MILVRPIAGALVLLLSAGCATSGPLQRLARHDPGSCPLSPGGLLEVACRHCNCLMPAGLDPAAACPVCRCHRMVHDCVRQ